MFISESPHVVSPVQKEINRTVDSSLKNLREQNLWMKFYLIVFNLLYINERVTTLINKENWLGIISKSCKFEKLIIFFVFTSFAKFSSKLRNSKQEMVIVVYYWSIYNRVVHILSTSENSKSDHFKLSQFMKK